jgi:predicted Zn-dependent protease
MKMSLTKHIFYSLGPRIFSSLKDHEELTLTLNGEETLYFRFNNAKIRQTINVSQGFLNLNFSFQGKTCSWSLPFIENHDDMIDKLLKALHSLRIETATLPIDPYLEETTNHGFYEEDHDGHVLLEENIIPAVLHPAEGLDMVGLYSGGYTVRANMNSKGQKQWFSNQHFLVDFSLYDSNQNAIKGLYAGHAWDKEAYHHQISMAKEQLKLMKRPKKIVPPGHYRTYFAPAAVNELLSMMSWGAISASSWKKGESALCLLADHKKTLSPKFSLSENFKLGLCPPFNEKGEISKETLSLIKKGTLKTFLTNSKTAKECRLQSNGARDDESLQSPMIKTGTLKESDILKHLGTGLYLSNLHYLNWSDMRGGRMTGMTRFACFWVEEGKIIAPIEDLRFDESLYHFWGDQLIDFTNFQETFPDTNTYTQRSVGGSLVPGMLVENFAFTL